MSGKLSTTPLPNYNTFESSNSEKSTESEKGVKDFEDVLKLVGSDGKFQKRLLYWIVGPMALTMPILMTSAAFQLGDPAHSCHIPGTNPNWTYNSVEMESLKNLTTPREIGPDGLERFSQCFTYASLENHTEVPCRSGWDYDRTDYSGTLVTDFNWVCNKSNYATFVLMATNLGSLVSTVVYGTAGDSFGRRTVLLCSFFLMPIVRLTNVYTPKYFILFLVGSFLAGTAFPMSYIILFALVAEFVDEERRAWIYGFTWLMWVAGMSLTSLLAWLTSNWYSLGLANAAISLIPLLFCWFVPESPRWLLTKNRIEDAESILIKIGKENENLDQLRPGDVRRALIHLETIQDQDTQEKKKVNVFTILSSRRLAMNTFHITITWTVYGSIYYGIVFGTPNLAGNPYLNFFLLALVEVPTTFIGGILPEKTGRRWTHTCFAFLSGVGLGFVLWGTLNPFMSCIVIPSLLFSKFAVASAQLILRMQATELFPTELRLTGMGIIGCFGGSVLILVPPIMNSGKVSAFLEYGIFLGFCVVATISSTFLPETHMIDLPQTVKEAEAIGKDDKFWSFLPHRKKIQGL